MFSREDFIKFIPKPSNQDVILYDTSLKDLIDTDVYQEYKTLYSEFDIKKNKYLDLRKKIEEYNKKIDNLYLLNPSWSESDYLEDLQNSKKTYSILYNDIKKLETTIEISQKKIKVINSKIDLQLAKETKQLEEKKNNIHLIIQKNREQLDDLKNKLSNYEQDLQHINSQIDANEEEFSFLAQMEQELKLGNYKCKYCGSTVKVNSEKSPIFNKLYNNIEKNKKELEKLLEKKEKINTSIEYFKDEIKKVKIELNNNLEYTKDDYNFYNKKSVEILKLEGLRDELMNNILKAQKSLKTNPRFNSVKYKELKDKISKCELSLDNLKEMQYMKQEVQSQIEEYKTLEIELKKIVEQLKHYIQFLTIFFKIYEQKANEYCGENIKFKFYKLEDYKITEILEIIYNGTTYAELDNTEKKALDKILIQKFSIYL